MTTASVLYDFVTGDTGSSIKITCKDKETGAIISLVGASAKLRWVDITGVPVERTMQIVAPGTLGQVTYTFAANELFGPRMKFEVEVTDSANKIITTVRTIDVNVREQIG